MEKDGCSRDIEGCEDGLEVPFLDDYSSKMDVDSDDHNDKGSVFMVVLSTCVAVCGSFEFGSCVGYSAPTQSAIRTELDLSVAQFSMFGSIITIGAMIGAVASGRISDLVGRKWAMRLSAVICIHGWLAIYYSMGSWSLDAGRFFTGFGIGIFSYVVPVFIAEIAPKNLRGGLTTINQLMIVCGSSVAYLLGAVMTSRYLALIGIIPCLFLLVGLFFIPESPRWLAKVGREKDFDAALRKLRGEDADVIKEAAEIQAYVKSVQSLPKARILDLFGTKYIRSLFIGVGMMVFQQASGINGIGFYASDTFSAVGLSNGNTGTIAYAIVQVPITLVGAMLMDRTGRRPLLLVQRQEHLLAAL
ncbi:unnamed protein product [Cuscuta europaea]|uniref:Major facilitator superfamily (MFS) profile domain-containing protein n=1 Tax=Cuscuta europaea TaxID=41803 RepID=A0A9P1EJR9_CUSEU|nr:unnamed protein product [Cuscuta europaea]